TRALEDPVHAAAGARAEALDRDALVDVRGLDVEVVAVPLPARVHLCVGDGAPEHLLDVARGGARRERENRTRLRQAAGADLVDDQTRLARPHVHRLRDCLDVGARGGHRFTCVFWSPACPRKCRVGANSPSLWPTICSEMNTGTCFFPSW